MGELTRTQALRLAIPVMLAQAATALTGVVDTSVMAAFGEQTGLAAVAVASVVFSFLYWGFGFLRMTTTALTAQALGRSEPQESYAVLQRALCIGAAIGGALLLLSPVIRTTVAWCYPVEARVLSAIEAYFDARIWGAPAVLVGYGISGWLLGAGRTISLLVFQVVVNATNAALDGVFVAVLDKGAAGIGAGTAIAEWLGLCVGLMLVRGALTPVGPLWRGGRITELWAANRDVMLRTLALLLAFGWFVRSSASISTAVTAGNEVLLQFIAVAAFILDGYAFIAEKEAGAAFGAGSLRRLRRGLRVTTELALYSGACISVLYLVGGEQCIEWVVRDAGTRAVALEYLAFCAAVPTLGVCAYQLDGLFLGTTQGRAMRNASIMSCALYIATDLALRALWGNQGVWAAFLLLYVYRAVGLAVYLPSLFTAMRGRGGDAILSEATMNKATMSAFDETG